MGNYTKKKTCKQIHICGNSNRMIVYISLNKEQNYFIYRGLKIIINKSDGENILDIFYKFCVSYRYNFFKCFSLSLGVGLVNG